MDTVFDDFLKMLSPDNRAWVRSQSAQQQSDLANTWAAEVRATEVGVTNPAVEKVEGPLSTTPEEIANTIVGEARG